MTVVAALALEDRVIMGCDTATNHSGTFVHSARGKIGIHTTRNGERVLIGAAGNASIGRILDRTLAIEATPDDPADRDAADQWAGALAEAITSILADANPALSVPNTDQGGAIAGDLLVAWRQHVWLLFAHVAIRSNSAIVAIGSGRDIALGSLHAHIESLGRNMPMEKMRFAVGLACRLDSGCSVDHRGPIVLSTVVADA